MAVGPHSSLLVVGSVLAAFLRATVHGCADDQLQCNVVPGGSYQSTIYRYTPLGLQG